MTDRVTARREAGRDRLELTHWNGEGCGTNGTGGCSYCHGPSPADSYEVAREVLAAADEWDRANGYSVVRLDELERAWREGYQDGWSDRAHPGEDLARNPYRVLRESAEREANR